MTDLRKAAEMALELLGVIGRANNAQVAPDYSGLAWSAANDLRQALAQPEQEPVAWMWKNGTITTDPDYADGTWTPLYTAPPSKPDVNQELVEPQLHPKDVIKLALKAGFTKDAINVWLVSMEKLIAFAAPPSKPWVSLTDDEKLGSIWTNGSFHHGVEWAEAKLKEKNT